MVQEAVPDGMTSVVYAADLVSLDGSIRMRVGSRSVVELPLTLRLTTDKLAAVLARAIHTGVDVVDIKLQSSTPSGGGVGQDDTVVLTELGMEVTS